MDADILVVLLTILLVIFAVVIGPIIAIWAINTLAAPHYIQYNFWTWLAALCLFGSGWAGVSSRKSS